MNFPKLDGRRALQTVKRGSWALSVQCQLPLNCGQPKRLHLRVQWKAFP